jgi:hypothetical protein
LDGFSVETFLENCLTENVRRMSGFHVQLLQPRLLPALARVALSGVKLWPYSRRSLAQARVQP